MKPKQKKDIEKRLLKVLETVDSPKNYYKKIRDFIFWEIKKVMDKQKIETNECKICYGKGYSSQVMTVTYKARGGMVKQTTLVPLLCPCIRGQQIDVYFIARHLLKKNPMPGHVIKGSHKWPKMIPLKTKKKR